MEQTKVYESIGRCIYCGRNDVPLADEHIIPFGLSGKFVFRKASCTDCAKVTSAFEGRVLRNHLIAPRAAMGLKTRRPGERPRDFPVSLFREEPEGEVHEERRGSVQEQPVLLALPIFGPPRLLLCPEVRDLVDFPVTWTGFLGGKNNNEFLADLREGGFHGYDIELTVYPTDFAIMIAKIGYSHAVAVFGEKFFEAEHLTNLILGKGGEAADYVGNFPTANLEGDAESFHRLAIQMLDDGTAVARVKLFARIGTPEYIVALGKGDRDVFESKELTKLH